MKSPILGKEMVLKKENRVLDFRKEKFEVVYHYYLCSDSGKQFEDDLLSGLNITQVYNKYRERLRLPFPDEISAIREKFSLSARKMSDILGFGPNTYGNYEKGEIPSKANGRLIQLASDPVEFRKLAHLSGNLSKGLNRKIDELMASDKTNDLQNLSLIFKKEPLTRYNGYSMFKQDKVNQMILFFAKKMQPWKTKLNKLLFYADFLHYKNYGYSISGLRYVAINFGPVPDEYEILFTIGRVDNVFKKSYQEINDDATGEKILPMKNAKLNLGLFSTSELDCLNRVYDRFTSVSSSKIVEMSHKEPAWKDNYKKNRFIDYNYGFKLIHV